MKIPTPQVLTRAVRYHADVHRLISRLTRDGLIESVPTNEDRRRPLDTVLLESVDIATKTSRTTIAVLEASARLTCRVHSVTIEALPQAPRDGNAAVERVRSCLEQYVTSQSSDGDGLSSVTVTIPPLRDDSSLEERARLTADSTVAPLRVLASSEVDHPYLPLLAGAFAFDYLATFESLPPVAPGMNTCPDYLFYDARILLVIDHPTREAVLVGASIDPQSLSDRLDSLERAINVEEPDHRAPQSAPRTPPPAIRARPTVSDADYAATVETMQESIAAGDIYQVVPSRGFTLECPDALAAYDELRKSNPSPYMFYLAAPEFELFGASPESALQYSARTGEVSIRPIAGTRPRGLALDGSVDHELDIRLELELRSDAKEIAEHVMLIDLARNDVARVSVPGTRRVTDLMRVDRYSRVMHLVSEVTGVLAPGLDALDAYRASMTMGTLTGAPKLRAAELIRQTEGARRGSYGGSVGYLRGDGEFDTCIVIRSAFVAQGRALVQSGAGVVADSVPAREAAETRHKAWAVLAAIAKAQGRSLVIDTATATSAESERN